MPPLSVQGGPSYVEHFPVPALADSVRTVWVQTAGDAPYVQRHLPTGGVELQWPLGGHPHLVGPLTGPLVESIPAGTVVVGVRFHPSSAPLGGRSLEDLVDQCVAVDDLGYRWVERVGEAMLRAPTPEAALQVLQGFLVRRRSAVRCDPLVDEAVRRLMPWTPVDVATVADEVGLSSSQLRRRCLQALGIGPKALQRTLRFQGFLAFAQVAATASGRPRADGMARLAVDAGYADQSHLSREVRRLTGLTPTALLGDDLGRCLCGHDHAASYAPFLAGRCPKPRGGRRGVGLRDTFKTGDARHT
jgi:AraC-like DNA-binding protein